VWERIRLPGPAGQRECSICEPALRRDMSGVERCSGPRWEGHIRPKDRPGNFTLRNLGGLEPSFGPPGLAGRRAGGRGRGPLKPSRLAGFRQSCAFWILACARTRKDEGHRASPVRPAERTPTKPLGT